MEGRMTVCNMSHRVGRQGRADRARRDDVRLPRGPARGAQGRRLGRRGRALAHAASPTTDAAFDKEVVLDARELTPFVTWGTNPGQGVPLGASVPDPERLRRRGRPGRRRRRRLSTWRSTPARRCATSRSTRSSSARAPTAASRTCGPPPRSSRAARSPTSTRLLVVPGSVRVRLQAEDEGLDVVFKEAGARVARRRLLDVPGHEPRPAGAGRAQRLDLQPQLRGPAGQGRAHPPGVAAGRRGHRGHRPPGRALPTCRPLETEEEADGEVHHATPARRCRCAAATSTPTRSSRPSTSSGSPAPASRTGCSVPGATTRSSC